MNSRQRLFLAASLGLATFQAVATIAVFKPETEETARVIATAADPAGGFSVYTADAGVHHYDSNGRFVFSEAVPVEFLQTRATFFSFTDRLIAWPVEPGHHLITEQQPSMPATWEPFTSLIDPDPVCAVGTLASGLRLTRLWHGHEVRMSSRHADAEGGVWIHAADGRIFRFGPDCRALAVAMLPEPLVALHADPGSRAVVALTNGLELIKLTTDGIVWRRQLPNPSSSQSWMPMLTVLHTGEAVALYTRRSPNPSDWQTTNLMIAHAPDGTKLWEKPSNPLRRAVFPVQQGFVLVHQVGFTAFDRHGAISQDFEHPEQEMLWRFGPSVSTTRVWAEFYTADPDKTELLVFDSTSGQVRSWQLDWDFISEVGLANGTVVVSRRHGPHSVDPPPETLHLAASPPSLTGVPMPAATLLQGINASAADEAGSVLIVQDRSHWTIHLTDASMKPLWSRQVVDTESNHNRIKMQIALGAGRLCVLTEGSNPPGIAENLIVLECFRRSDGVSAHHPVVWSGQAPRLDPVIANHADVTFFEPNVPMAIRRYLIDDHGNLTQGHPPFSELSPVGAPFCICDALHFEDGSKVLLWRASGQLLFFPANGTGEFRTQWLGLKRGSLPLKNFAPGHGRLAILSPPENFLDQEFFIDFYSADGDYAGRVVLGIDFPSGGELSLLATTKDGWKAVLADVDLVRIWDIPKSVKPVHPDRIQSSPIKPLSARIGFDDFDTPAWSPRPWSLRSILDWDGEQLVLASYKSSITTILWLDPDTLEINASASRNFRPRFRFEYGPEFHLTADGRVYLAGEAPGPRGHQPAVWQLSAKDHAPRPVQNPGSFNGAWFDPSVSGQGFFLDFVESANLLFGAWFTFSVEDTYQPSALRWYTLAATPVAGTSRAEGEIYLNRNGRFEQGPVTQSERVGRFSLWNSGPDRLQIAMYFDDQHEQGLQLGHALERVIPVASGKGVRHWYDPTISGQGLLLAQPLASPGPLFAGWFTYDPALKKEGPYAQHWFVLIDATPASAGATSRSATLYRATGGRLGIRGTSNVQPVGEATLIQSGCDRIEFHYDFDENRYADTFLGLRGTRVLQAIGGCP